MSIEFKPTKITNLYALKNAVGWVGYLFPKDNTTKYNSFSLEDSLNTYKGIYLFSPNQPDIEASNFISSIWFYLNVNHSSTGYFNERCFLWLNEDESKNKNGIGQAIVFTKYNYWGTTKALKYELNAQRVWINESIFMAIPPFCEITVETDKIHISRMPTSTSKKSRYGTYLTNILEEKYIRLGDIDDRGVGKEVPLTIPMIGANCGCLQLDLSFPFNFEKPRYFIYGKDKYPYEYNGDERNEYTILETGLKYFYLDTNRKDDNELVYPLFKETSPAGFKGSFDFSDIFNRINPRRTFFAFTGKNIINQKESGNTVLPTLLTTNFGKIIHLTPMVEFQADGSPSEKSALFVFSNAVESLAFNKKRYYWVPQGDFILNPNNSDAEKSEMLLCGISGTETISYTPSSKKYTGDRISFIPKKPAYSTPFTNTNEKGSREEKTTLLTDKYTTSWVTLRKGDSTKGDANSYFSQPNKAPLFESGKISGTLNYSEVPSADLIALDKNKGDSFPLAPSAKVVPVLGTLEEGDIGYYTQKDLTKYEIEILNPFRKQTIASYYKNYRKNSVRAYAEEIEPCPIENLTTTPQGFLVNLNSDKTEWKCLTLANNESNNAVSEEPPIPLRFKNIDLNDDITGLQSAFQTNEQFLVISDPSKPENPAILDYYIQNFQDQINIADWPFLLDIAHQNKESNTDSKFTNIIIFKFCSKSIEERINDPNLWTDPNVFNQEDDIPQLIKWIQDYIATARKANSAATNENNSSTISESIQSQGFKQFIQIIEDENWHGVLSLQVTLNLKNLPSEIKAILAGIDTSRFAAHHLGIVANQIKTKEDNTLDTDFKSSLFGMISYFNTTYLSYQNGTVPVPVIYPKSQGEFDFQVLNLQVLFVNSLISDFKAKIQLNMNVAFDELVMNESASGHGGIYKNSILMDGQYDKKNGSTSYTFSVSNPNSLTLSSTAIEVVTITGVEMATVDDVAVTNGSLTGANKNNDQDAWITTRFNISGNLKFQNVKEFDLFSFDSLPFSNLILDMKFNLDNINPNDQTPKKTFVFTPENIVFKHSNSITRAGSLVPHFPIELENLIYHNPAYQQQEEGKDKKPITTNSLGYIQVEAPLPTAPVGDTWYALKFKLNMGSIGALASKVGFNAEVILAWSPGKDNNQTQIYAKMPFSGGIAGTSFSIEGVLKFAIGSILFFNDPAINQYSMIFTEVGVSLLGKKLPPNGSTVLYLFGNPDNPTAGDSGKSNLGWFGAYKQDDKNKELENIES